MYLQEVQLGGQQVFFIIYIRTKPNFWIKVNFEHDHDGEGAADLPPDIPGGRVWGNSRTLPRILLHDSLGRHAEFTGFICVKAYDSLSTVCLNIFIYELFYKRN